MISLLNKTNSALRKFFSHQGVSLVELLIVLSLLVVVLSIGYMLFSFGYNSFTIAQARSDVQQNIRIASSFISNEIRNATSVTLWDASKTIPNEATLDWNEHIIFVNGNGKLEYRTKDIRRIIPDGISDRIDFDVVWEVSVASNQILAYQISGTRDSGQQFTLASEVFIENLAFRNRSIGTEGSTFEAVYYIKQPSATLIAMSVNPSSIEENPDISWNYTFELSLLNETFAGSLTGNDFEIGGAFEEANMSILIASRDLSDNAIASVTIQGKLAVGSTGVGTIKVKETGTEGGTSLEARVLVLTPVGKLEVLPSEVDEDAFFNQIFDITVINNTFEPLLDVSYVNLAGDFSGLTIQSFSRDASDPNLAYLTINGSLQHTDGLGAIIISGDAFTLGSNLTGFVTVIDGTYVQPVTLSVTTQGEGTTNPTGVTSHAPNTEVQLKATPAENWEFQQWTVNGVFYSSDAETPYVISANTIAKAFFRTQYVNIPLGSYVRYNNVDYIKLSNTRLMNRFQSTNAMSWSANASWPTKAELDQLTAEQRKATTNYWTGTSFNPNDAYYVDTNGAIVRGRKSSQYNQRTCITVSSTLYVIAGTGTESDPYILSD